ncbi:hypothetical protein APB26_32760 [Pseudomonas aeruginosa]|nr:hypothetical protein APB26_32760 [Pseudomonas aeruginosa]RPV61428.1 hypothetical protein IPC838_19105 [Pseudomonas aeruginosa]
MVLCAQIQNANGVEDLFKKTRNLWSLGYCFGVLQASLEAHELEAKLERIDYQNHVGVGLGRVYVNEALGRLYYEVGVSSMRIEQFHDGLIAGVTEYVKLLNEKTVQASGLTQYLRMAKVEESPLSV